MKALLFVPLALSLVGCAATTWTTQHNQDVFTDKTSCRVIYGGEFGRAFVKASGGIHYYPFIETVEGETIFGIHNDYNVPVGDVQIRIDDHEAITISYTETPVYYSAVQKAIDLSYLNSVQGVDTAQMKAAMESTTANISKMTSPYTAVSGEKAQAIIEQLKNGKQLKMRIIGYGTNSLRSNTGEYVLDGALQKSLGACGI